jgi:hypothetical protein
MPIPSGPLVLDGELGDPAAAAAYYRAWRSFAGLLRDPGVLAHWELRLRLQPGTCVAFNQRRLLHGRTPFAPSAATEPGVPGGGVAARPPRRWLEGCYGHADDFASRHRALALRFGHGTRGIDELPRLGTGNAR